MGVYQVPDPRAIAYRLDRIEAILRANSMHEPECDYFTPPYCESCDCWLSEANPSEA